MAKTKGKKAAVKAPIAAKASVTAQAPIAAPDNPDSGDESDTIRMAAEIEALQKEMARLKAQHTATKKTKGKGKQKDTQDDMETIQPQLQQRSKTLDQTDIEELAPETQPSKAKTKKTDKKKDKAKDKKKDKKKGKKTQPEPESDEEDEEGAEDAEDGEDNSLFAETEMELDEQPGPTTTGDEGGDGGESEVDGPKEDLVDLLTTAVTHRSSKADRFSLKLQDPKYVIPEDLGFDAIAQELGLDEDIHRHGAIDDTEMTTYERLKAARKGVVIIDFGDKEQLALFKWNEYNGRSINENDAQKLGWDFFNSSKRHYEYPIFALVEDEWFASGKPLKDFDTIRAIQMVKFDADALGANKVFFCSGAHRKRAMEIYKQLLLDSEKKVLALIAKVKENLRATPDSAIRQGLLVTSEQRLHVLRRRISTAMHWMVEVYTASMLGEPERRALSKNKDTHDVPMRPHERTYAWRELVREGILNWTLVHPPPEPGPPRVGTSEWKEFVGSACANDKYKLKERLWLFEQPVAYEFYDAFMTYPYYRLGDTLAYDTIHGAIRPPSNANSGAVRTVGHIWSQVLLHLIRQMHFVATPGEFNAKDKVIVQYLASVKARAPFAPYTADQTTLAYDRLMKQYTKVPCVEIWPTALMHDIDQMYVAHVAPAVDELGRDDRPTWSNTMAAYWAAVRELCEKTWTLLAEMSLDPEEGEVASFALAKFDWVLELAAAGDGYNLPLPTQSFVKTFYSKLNNASSTIQWLTTLLDPYADAAIRQPTRGYVDYTHYLVFMLRSPDMFHSPSQIAPAFWHWILRHLSTLQCVDTVFSAKDIPLFSVLRQWPLEQWVKIASSTITPTPKRGKTADTPAKKPAARSGDKLATVRALLGQGWIDAQMPRITALKQVLISRVPTPGKDLQNAKFVAADEAMSFRLYGIKGNTNAMPYSPPPFTKDELSRFPELHGMQLADPRWCFNKDISKSRPGKCGALALSMVIMFAGHKKQRVAHLDASSGGAVFLALRTMFFRFLDPWAGARIGTSKNGKFTPWDAAIENILSATTDIKLDDAALSREIAKLDRSTSTLFSSARQQSIAAGSSSQPNRQSVPAAGGQDDEKEVIDLTVFQDTLDARERLEQLEKDIGRYLRFTRKLVSTSADLDPDQRRVFPLNSVLEAHIQEFAKGKSRGGEG
ncbi:hypothetical protein C8Q77DRAFT_1154317 [Trametes polyzona]|nr:hypothetical protein C8Q77DRAFT_1154317 [Trametes polyzona]